MAKNFKRLQERMSPTARARSQAKAERMIDDLPRDYPLDEILQSMATRIVEGHTVWFKFTCAHCGARQTDEQPNRFCRGGYSCEACGGMTYPTAGNFLLLMRTAIESTHSAEETPHGNTQKETRETPRGEDVL